jgi:hypothetical protein
MLTQNQKDRIREQAIDAMFTDCQQDDGYLHDLLENYFAMTPEEDRWTLLSSEKECAAELLGFDPETGEACEDDLDPFREADNWTECPQCGEELGWNDEDGLDGQTCSCGHEFTSSDVREEVS